MEDAFTKEPAEVVAHFGVNSESGLTPEQFKKQLDKYGFNGENLPRLEETNAMCGEGGCGEE